MLVIRRIFIVFGCFFLGAIAKADEGMWLPQLLEALNEKRMKQLGMKMNASDIYNINKASLKDAVVSFGGFCTGEIISNNGLILTNHHCGFDALQNHSTIDHNFIKDGFWAKDKKEELANPGLFVTFIVRIDDVTDKILTGINEGLDESERQSQLDKNAKELLDVVKKEAYEEVFIKPFFEGNKYYLFVTETYRDIRLVGAPPSSIGNFGKDTDNWMWPRHTGDFSIFRIYAGKDNKPASYSPDNVPYKPKKFLSISLKGLKKNDFTMIFGFPGKTMEYLPSEAVSQIKDVNDPAKIYVREKALFVIDKYMRADEKIKIKYASKYAGISNAWKKWQGEVLGLTNTEAVYKKQRYEHQYTTLINNNTELKSKYENVLQLLNDAYIEVKPYALARDYFLETTSKVELFTIINRLKALNNKIKKELNKEEIQKEIEGLKNFCGEFDKDVDRDLFAAMMEIYIEKQDPEYVCEYAKAQKNSYKDYEVWAKHLYDKSIFLNSVNVINILENNPQSLDSLLNKDEAAVLVKAVGDFYNSSVALKLNEIQPKINRLQRVYMQAQMAAFKNKNFYPDANSTLRVAFGNINGYNSPTGKKYNYYTFLDGVMEKYKPGDYEFDVPEKLRALYKAKDYGKYGVNGKMPVCFIASNHTTGGNSGSPVLDAYGNLVGINFDRVWEGTMSDINYDPSICRNIMVDIRYILFIIDKYAGAGHLVEEMNLVFEKNRN